MLYIAVMVFFETAQILLPWTISATVLAGLAGLGIGRLDFALSRRRMVSCVSSLLLTIAIGYIGFFAFPPKPPAPHPDQGLAILVEMPKVNVSADDLQTMLPLHLGISGLIGMVIVASLSGSRGPAVLAPAPVQEVKPESP